MTNAPVPSELRVSADRATLRVAFDDGTAFALTAEMLRVLSPSAEVQGHSPDERVTLGGKRDVLIADLVPVGHYAIRIVFDDEHASGLYTWAYLHEVGRDRDRLWAAYLAELDEKGLSRDRPGSRQ